MPPRKRQLSPYSFCLSLSFLLFSADEISADATDAKALFIAGAEFFKAEEYSKAYDAFRESYKKQPVLTALYNIAMCEIILGRYVESIASFEKLIEENGNKLKRHMLEKAVASIEKLKTLIGHLRLEDAPVGARLWIDGKQLAEIGVDQTVPLNPGRYAIRVTLTNHHPFETGIQIDPGTTVVLQPSLSRKASESSNAPVLSNASEREETSSLSKSFGIEPKDRQSARHRPSAWSIGGVSTAIVGLAGVGVGALFTYKQYRNREDAVAANDKFEQDGDYEAYTNEFTDIRDHRYRRADIGMKIGYIAGGIAVVTGVLVTMVEYMIERRKKKRENSLRPTQSGALIEF